jgi:hypothetical protein
MPSVVRQLRKGIFGCRNGHSILGPHRFINNFSHNTSIIRALIVSDVSECKAVVTACLNCVRSWDTQYFQDLEASIQ